MKTVDAISIPSTRSCSTTARNSNSSLVSHKEKEANVVQPKMSFKYEPQVYATPPRRLWIFSYGQRMGDPYLTECYDTLCHVFPPEIAIIVMQSVALQRRLYFEELIGGIPPIRYGPLGSSVNLC